MPEAHAQHISKLHDLLVKQRRNLESELRASSATTKPVTLDQQSVGRVSRIDAIQQQQMALANQHQATLILRKIEAALARIDDGSYGNCLACAEPIALSRLQAQPYAELCITCQSASESKT